MERKIRVLVVDDSALMRKLVSNIINHTSDIEVADTAVNGLFALKKIKRNDIDLILLDIEMPEMNGIEFLKIKKEVNIQTPVVVLSSMGAKRPEITIEALELGASDFIIKPSGAISMDIETIGHEIVSAIRKYGGAALKNRADEVKIDLELEKIVKEHHQPEVHTAPPKEHFENLVSNDTYQPGLESRMKNVEIILLGISTGGPAALRQLFPKVTNKKYPILIVQHMPPGFTKEFARGLDKITDLSVKEAEDSEPIRKGSVYIAPGDKHLSFIRNGNGMFVSLLDTPPVNGHKPSVETLYETALKYRMSTLSIIMTGMGKDGAFSLKKLHEQGSVTIAQSPQDCVVFGMPRAAVELGGVDKILDINDIADFINKI